MNQFKSKDLFADLCLCYKLIGSVKLCKWKFLSSYIDYYELNDFTSKRNTRQKKRLEFVLGNYFQLRKATIKVLML